MTTFRAWKVQELVESVMGRGDRHIVIPSFQRSFVWNQRQREAFIKSVRANFPVGCILLYHAGFDRSIQRLQLVDGLQRTVTLKKYFDNVFFHSRDVVEESSEDISELVTILESQNLGTVSRDQLVAHLCEWMTTRTSFDANAGYSNVDLWMHLIRALTGNPPTTPAVRLMAHLQTMLQNFRSTLDISTKELPVIEFSGAAEDLPEIFDRLNTGGTKLAKYDILAASWNDQYVRINSSDLISAVKERYRELLSLGLELESIDDQRFEDFDGSYEYLIFEFVFALGRCLKQQFPKLFGRNKEASTEVDSLGFTLVTLASGLKISQLADFAPIIARQKTADRYYGSIEQACTYVQRALDPYLTFPMDREPTRKLAHTEFQIASIVASIFRLMFDENLASNPSWKRAESSLVANVRQWYLYDLLRKTWRNSGDSKAFAFVSRSQVIESVPLESFSTTVDAYFQESLEAKGKDLLPGTRAILKLLADRRLRTMPSTHGRKFTISQIIDNAELKATRIAPLNIANIVLQNPDSGRIFDPSGLSGRRPATDEAPHHFFEGRFSQLKSRLLEILYGSEQLEERAGELEVAIDQ